MSVGGAGVSAGDAGVNLETILSIARGGEAFFTRFNELKNARAELDQAAKTLRQEREALQVTQQEPDALTKSQAEASAAKAEYDRLAAGVRAVIKEVTAD